MYNRRWRASVAFLLLAAAFATGCGDDDDTSSSAELSKAQFLKQGNAICAKQGKAIGVKSAPIIQQNAQTPEKAQAEIISRVVIPHFEAEIRELRELGTPAGDTQDVDEVLSAIQSTVDRLRTTPTINADASFKVNHPYRPGEEIAAEYGLTACGHP